MRLSLQDPVSSSGLKLPQSSQVWCISSAPVLRSDFLSDNREDSWLYICLVNFLKLSKKKLGVVWREERFLLNPLSLANSFSKQAETSKYLTKSSAAVQTLV